MNEETLKIIKSNFLDKKYNLSPYATKDSDAIREFKEDNDDIRPQFFHDIDRIIYSLSYTRYLDKTQVFSFEHNDHICKRIVHVQFVSKIARTIGRALKLNEDLIEAIALGHDIGHTPIGHVGEKILNDISLREMGKMFSHNVQSVRTYLVLERGGKGNNLTIQTLDGILCHNGEMLSSHYEPIVKTKEEFIEQYELCYTDKEVLKQLRPMTLEGCVVRISDIIAYLGRDIEDAIRLGIIKKEQIPKSIKEILGSTNREIINTIILDIIKNSVNKPYIELSNDVYNAIFELKKFNYKEIYAKANTEETISFYTKGMNLLFSKYLKDLETENRHSSIFTAFLIGKSTDYLKNTSHKRMVIDFISGMTDDYFLGQINYFNEK